MKINWHKYLFGFLLTKSVFFKQGTGKTHILIPVFLLFSHLCGMALATKQESPDSLRGYFTVGMGYGTCQGQVSFQEFSHYSHTIFGVFSVYDTHYRKVNIEHRSIGASYTLFFSKAVASFRIFGKHDIRTETEANGDLALSRTEPVRLMTMVNLDRKWVGWGIGLASVAGRNIPSLELRVGPVKYFYISGKMMDRSGLSTRGFFEAGSGFGQDFISVGIGTNAWEYYMRTCVELMDNRLSLEAIWTLKGYELNSELNDNYFNLGLSVWWRFNGGGRN